MLIGVRSAAGSIGHSSSGVVNRLVAIRPMPTEFGYRVMDDQSGAADGHYSQIPDPSHDFTIRSYAVFHHRD